MPDEEYLIVMTAYKLNGPEREEEIASSTCTVNCVTSVKVVQDVMSAMTLENAHGWAKGQSMRELVTAPAMEFGGQALKEAIANLFDDPVGYCDLAYENPDGDTGKTREIVQAAFMELNALAAQFKVDFQAEVDRRTEFERDRLAEMLNLPPRVPESLPEPVEPGPVAPESQESDISGQAHDGLQRRATRPKLDPELDADLLDPDDWKNTAAEEATWD
jgi:hypothetical protein